MRYGNIPFLSTAAQCEPKGVPSLQWEKRAQTIKETSSKKIKETNKLRLGTSSSAAQATVSYRSKLKESRSACLLACRLRNVTGNVWK